MSEQSIKDSNQKDKDLPQNLDIQKIKLQMQQCFFSPKQQSQNVIMLQSNIMLEDKDKYKIMLPTKRQKKSGSVSSFIKKVWSMLEDTQYSHIVTWVEKQNSYSNKYGFYPGQGSSSFKIIDIKEFQQVVLPKYFKHSNISSFIRQLNMYNFHKIRGQKGDLEFQNEKFIKQKKHLLSQIKRKQTQPLGIATNPLIQSQKDLLFSRNRQSEGNISIGDQISQFNKQLCQEENMLKDGQFANLFKQSFHQDDRQELGDSPQKYKSCQSSQTLRVRRVEVLNYQNTRLKQLKESKIQKLKLMENSNKKQIQIKFSKVMFTILSQKLKLQLTKNNTHLYKKQQTQNQNNSKFNAMENIVQHILSEQQPQSFKQYREGITKLLTENNFSKSG